MRIKASGYSQHGASRYKPAFLKWTASSKSPHEDISRNIELLRNRSRDLYTGSPLGRGAIERIALNAIGSGLRLNVRIDAGLLGISSEYASEWSMKTESEFDYWASSKQSDYRGMLNFYELQALAFKSILLDGECLMMLQPSPIRNSRYSLSVLLIEAERLKTPPTKPKGAIIDGGVEVDKMGRVCAYWIANRNPNAELTGQPVLEYMRVPAYDNNGRTNIYHLMNPERIAQTRGVPLLAPVIEQLKQLSRYTDAELTAAVVSGMYAIFFTHEPRDSMSLTDEDYASEHGLGPDERYPDITQGEMNGAIMDLPEGVKPVGISPNRPNQNFDSFVKSLVRQIGSALGIPSELLLLNFTASYSASRGALLEAWKLFKYWRVWFANNFCQPIYEEFLREAIILGYINAPKYMNNDYVSSLYTWCEWVGTSQGQLNPVQEVEASILKVQNGFSTYQRETSELTGGDYELNAQQLRRERDMLQE